jgi:hypothetical protein
MHIAHRAGYQRLLQELSWKHRQNPPVPQESTKLDVPYNSFNEADRGAIKAAREHGVLMGGGVLMPSKKSLL